MHSDQCVLFTPFCFLSVHGWFIWWLHLSPSLCTLVQWTHPGKNGLWPGCTDLPFSLGWGKTGAQDRKGRGPRGPTYSSMIFKKPLMPRVLGILASVLIANANILAAAVAARSFDKVSQTPDPRLLILYIWIHIFILVWHAHAYTCEYIHIYIYLLHTASASKFQRATQGRRDFKKWSSIFLKAGPWLFP